MRNAFPAGEGAAQGRIEQQRFIPEHSSAQPQVRQFRVIVARDLWRRCVVCVEPATITHQPRSFPDHGAAMAYAEELARLEGWPICDRTGEREQ